jgi:hypothetical protein
MTKSNARKRKKKRSGRPTKYTAGVGRALVRLVMEGRTTDEAAREISVHPATVYRWQNRYPKFYEAMREAQRVRFYVLHPPSSYARPWVSWRKDCPECGGAVEVRTTWGMLKWWRCEHWPLGCDFAHWRPPAHGSCPECGGVLLWSHSRKSVGCDWCGYRERS